MLFAVVEPVTATHQQGVAGLSGGGTVFPHRGLFLGEEPHLQLVESLLILVDLCEGTHNLGVGGDMRLEAEVAFGPVHADLLVLHGVFLEGGNHRLGILGVAVTVE